MKSNKAPPLEYWVKVLISDGKVVISIFNSYIRYSKHESETHQIVLGACEVPKSLNNGHKNIFIYLDYAKSILISC